jgi:hypothetical protein
MSQRRNRVSGNIESLLQSLGSLPEGSDGYIPLRDRIATFDNDGTLWCEQPLGQGMFLLSQIERQIGTQPDLAKQPVVEALLNDDKDYWAQPEAMAELIQVVAAISANMPQAEFERQAQAFLARAEHPEHEVKYTELGDG